MILIISLLSASETRTKKNERVRTAHPNVNEMEMNRADFGYLAKRTAMMIASLCTSIEMHRSFF